MRFLYFFWLVFISVLSYILSKVLIINNNNVTAYLTVCVHIFENIMYWKHAVAYLKRLTKWLKRAALSYRVRLHVHLLQNIL